MTVQARQDALRAIDTKLTNLKLAAGDLRSIALWSPKQTVTSGTEGVLSARQLTGAAPGGYTVSVSSLASADSRTYAWNAGGGTVSVDYKAGDANTTQTKNFDLTGMSLDDAVSTVNSDATSPVWAVNVGGKLSLSRRETGDHDTWGFAASGTAVGAITSTRDGEDATYTVAGDATTYTSHTNVATEGLPGVELTFKSIGTSTVTVSAPAANPADVAAKLKAFVSAYNDTVDLVRSKLTEKKRRQPAERRRRPGGRALRRRLALGDADVHAPVDLTAGLDGLGVKVAAIGSGNSPDALAGKLTFDQWAFDAAWATSPTDVKAKIGSPTPRASRRASRPCWRRSRAPATA